MAQSKAQIKKRTAERKKRVKRAPAAPRDFRRTDDGEGEIVEYTCIYDDGIKITSILCDGRWMLDCHGEKTRHWEPGEAAFSVRNPDAFKRSDQLSTARPRTGSAHVIKGSHAGKHRR